MWPRCVASWHLHRCLVPWLPILFYVQRKKISDPSPSWLILDVSPVFAGDLVCGEIIFSSSPIAFVVVLGLHPRCELNLRRSHMPGDLVQFFFCGLRIVLSAVWPLPVSLYPLMCCWPMPFSQIPCPTFHRPAQVVGWCLSDFGFVLRLYPFLKLLRMRLLPSRFSVKRVRP
jgi:hypothetical protein